MEKIIDFDFEGRGIARTDGVVTFVKNALPGEVVELANIKKNKNYNEAQVLEYLEISKKRIQPKCPYYEDCGGCSLMHVCYAETLKFKENKVQTTLKKYANLTMDCKPIIASEEMFGYRNKARFQINNNIGYYAERTNDFVNIDKCLICDAEINKAIIDLKKINLKAVTSITVRASKFYHEIMIIVEANKSIDLSPLKKYSSVYLKIGDDYTLKFGESKIFEKMNDFKFAISPASFFQVNTLQAIKLYDKVKEYAALTGSENVLDLYCGTGTIGLYLASKAKHVYGIEINRQAIADANFNKELNNISNIDFFAMNANQFLNKIKDNIDVVIVDPPRGGLDKKTIYSLLKLASHKIIYVSCCAATLACDLNILKDKYNILEVTPIDMFPFTHHCESITVLERRI